MVDPFFQNQVQNEVNNNPNSTNNPTNSVGNDKAWDTVKLLNNQQEQIKNKYQELKNLYENNKLTIEQKQQVQEQMKKLSDLYTQNKQTLATLSTSISGEKQIYVNKDVQVKTQKNNKKVSFKGILIGCAIIFIFLMWWLAAVFYYLIQNPNQLTSVGIDPSTATQLLQTFATIFFGLLFFSSLGILITNFYRLIVSKNKKKIWFIFSIVFGFILLIATLVWWARVLDILRNIDTDSFVDSNKLLKPYIQLKDNTAYLNSDTSLVVIAPVNMFFALNADLFNKQIVPKLWAVTISNITLNCGNGQALDMDMQSASFKWACFFQDKWNYSQTLNISYINNSTSEKLSDTINVWELPVKSAITIRTNQSEPVFSKNEVILWTNPIKVTYDASDIFTDFQLSEYKIIWDADNDGEADKSDTSSYTHLYTWAKLYNVNIRFPLLNDYIYTFPVRIEQSDVPVAQVGYNKVNDTEFNISVSFYQDNPDITEYIFSIIDKKNNQNIDTISSNSPNINYIFPGNGLYSIKVKFITKEWKQGIAESENIDIGGSQFQISYDIFAKTPTTPQFKKANTNWTLEITEIPTILKVQITNIVPNSSTLQKRVLIDWQPVISTDDSFQVTIDENKDYILSIIVEDPNRDAKTEETINIKVKRDDIIWKLLVFPDTVWTAPFTVKFDASTTTINDPDDEIVYFSRDFGDWVSKPNLSQSVISHTYNYDFDNENGTYYPKVTIQTKKWRELLIWSGTIISVKKENVNLTINIDSHPAQIANMWDKVDLSLDITGLPSTIKRDFWNENTLECSGRECVETSQIYTDPGEYRISASVMYEDRPTIDWTINLVIK